MMPRLWMVLVLALLLGLGAVRAWGEPAAPPCAAPEYRSFDFWIGSWQVVNASGVHVGDNVITVEESGCVLMERWTGVKGSTGQSMSFFDASRGQDASRGKWRQLWISPGSRIEIEGDFVGAYMILEGTIDYLSDGARLPFRGTWNLLPDGRVRQFFEESRQAGVWTPWFEGFYVRAPAAMTSLDKAQ